MSRERWRFRRPQWWGWAKWGLLFAGAIAALLGGVYTVIVSWEQRPDPGPGGGERAAPVEDDDDDVREAAR